MNGYDYSICYYVTKGTDGVLTVHGYRNDVDEGVFFYDVSKVYCFEDIEEERVTEIVWHGRHVRYKGWQPGMKFEFTSLYGFAVWTGYFPQWEH